MIPQTQVELVYDFLSQNYDGTLDSIYKQFLKKMPDTGSPFHCCYLLFQAICDNVLPQRLRFVATYIVHECYRGLPNPFPLGDILTQSPNERRFVTGLLNKEQFGQVTLKQLVDDLEKPHELKSEKCPHSRELRQVIQMPTQLTNDTTQLCSLNTFEFLSDTFLGFELDQLRPIPEVVITQAEWIELAQQLEVIWDYSIEINNDQVIETKELMQKAFISKLSVKEAQYLLDLLNKEKRFALESGMSAKYLPKLIEKNPEIASFFLARINQCGVNIHDYFDCLITMELTLHSMEVVNKLSNSMKLPEAFLHMYITKCIELCENTNNKQQAYRYARLVSLLIKSLIKGKNLDPRKVFTELQGFCIEFNKVPEATLLFKLVKQHAEDDKKQPQQ